MADKSAVGKTGKPFKMHVDWSKVREFARAINSARQALMAARAVLQWTIANGASTSKCHAAINVVDCILTETAPAEPKEVSRG